MKPFCWEEDCWYPFFLNISASWTSADRSLLPIRMRSLFLHYKPYSNVMFWNNKHLLSRTPTCVGQESGSALSAWFWLTVSHKVAVTVSAKPSVIWSLICHQKIHASAAHEHACELMSTVGTGVCSSPHRHLLRAALSVFTTWLLTSSGKLGHLREPAKSKTQPPYDLALKIMSAVYHSLWTRPQGQLGNKKRRMRLYFWRQTIIFKGTCFGFGFLAGFLSHGLSMGFWLFRPGWLQTHQDPPALAFWILRHGPPSPVKHVLKVLENIIQIFSPFSEYKIIISGINDFNATILKPTYF